MKNESRKILIESRYMGDIPYHKRYARAAMLDSFRRGEAPFASHLLYPQVLNDSTPEERRQGIEAGLLWGRAAELTAVYFDLGVSDGMEEGIKRAVAQERPWVWRSLGGEWANVRHERTEVASALPWARRPPVELFGTGPVTIEVRK